MADNHQSCENYLTGRVRLILPLLFLLYRFGLLSMVKSLRDGGKFRIDVPQCLWYLRDQLIWVGGRSNEVSQT